MNRGELEDVSGCRKKRALAVQFLEFVSSRASYSLYCTCFVVDRGAGLLVLDPFLHELELVFWLLDLLEIRHGERFVRSWECSGWLRDEKLGRFCRFLSVWSNCMCMHRQTSSRWHRPRGTWWHRGSSRIQNVTHAQCRCISHIFCQFWHSGQKTIRK